MPRSTPPTEPDCVPVLALLARCSSQASPCGCGSDARPVAALAVDRNDDRTRAGRQRRRGHAGPLEAPASARGFQAALELFSGSAWLSKPRRSGSRSRHTRRQRRFEEAPRAQDVRAPLRDPGRRCGGGVLRELGAPARTFPKGHGPLTKRETEVLTSWSEDAPTPRSRNGSTSAANGRAPTSRASWGSSAYGTEPRWPRTRCASRPANP